MERAYANKNIPPVECTNYKLGYWRIRWDFQPVPESEEAEEGMDDLVSFQEYQFDHKPTMDEVKAVIEANSDNLLHEWREYSVLLDVSG